MPSASFAEPHTYRVDGHVVPSVTQVFTLAGMSYVSDIPPRILERAAAIGTAVHQAAELLDEDDLDLDSLDPSITGYVLAYQKFREATGFQPELVEHRRIATVLGLRYGMCVDRVGMIAGQKIILDLKTSSKQRPEWAIQTVAYAMGLELEARRAALHLAKDGSYSLIEHADRGGDERVWESALQLAYWRLSHGAKVNQR